MNAEIMNQLKAIEADEVFMKELFALDTPEKIQAKLAEKDVNLSMDEVKELICYVVDTADAMEGKGELDEESLDGVAGGSIAGMAIFIGMTAAGIYIGWRSARGRC